MTVITLPPVLDTAAARPLWADLLDRIERRQTILLDGPGVERIGLACLQVLASAKATAEAEALPFAIAAPSAALVAAAGLGGLAAVLVAAA